MPTRNEQVKQETRVAQVKQNRKALSGRLKATELSACGSAKDAGNASLVSSLSDSQPRRESTLRNPARETSMVGEVTPQWPGDQLQAGLLAIFQQLNQQKEAAIPLPAKAGSLLAVNS